MTDPQLTIDEYRKLLKRHDWYYEYSDDHSVWKQGQRAELALREIARSNGGEYEREFRREWESRFGELKWL